MYGRRNAPDPEGLAAQVPSFRTRKTSVARLGQARPRWNISPAHRRIQAGLRAETKQQDLFSLTLATG